MTIMRTNRPVFLPDNDLHSTHFPKKTGSRSIANNKISPLPGTRPEKFNKLRYFKQYLNIIKTSRSGITYERDKFKQLFEQVLCLAPGSAPDCIQNLALNESELWGRQAITLGVKKALVALFIAEKGETAFSPSLAHGSLYSLNMTFFELWFVNQFTEINKRKKQNQKYPTTLIQNIWHKVSQEDNLFTKYSGLTDITYMPHTGTIHFGEGYRHTEKLVALYKQPNMQADKAAEKSIKAITEVVGSGDMPVLKVAKVQDFLQNAADKLVEETFMRQFDINDQSKVLKKILISQIGDPISQEDYLLADNLVKKIARQAIINEVKDKIALKEKHKLPDITKKIHSQINGKLTPILLESHRQLYSAGRGLLVPQTQAQEILNKLVRQLAVEITKIYQSVKLISGGMHKQVEFDDDNKIGLVRANPKEAQAEFANEDRLGAFLHTHPSGGLLSKYISVQKPQTDLLNPMLRMFSIERNLTKYELFENYIEKIKELDDRRVKYTIATKLLLEMVNLLAIMSMHNISNNDMHGANLKIAFTRSKYSKTNLNQIDNVVAFDWGHLRLGSSFKAKNDLGFHLNLPNNLRNLYTTYIRWQNKRYKNIFFHKTPLAHICNLFFDREDDAISFYKQLDFNQLLKQLIKAHVKYSKSKQSLADQEDLLTNFEQLFYFILPPHIKTNHVFIEEIKISSSLRDSFKLIAVTTAPPTSFRSKPKVLFQDEK